MAKDFTGTTLRENQNGISDPGPEQGSRPRRTDNRLALSVGALAALFSAISFFGVTILAGHIVEIWMFNFVFLIIFCSRKLAADRHRAFGMTVAKYTFLACILGYGLSLIYLAGKLGGLGFFEVLSSDHIQNLFGQTLFKNKWKIIVGFTLFPYLVYYGITEDRTSSDASDKAT